jgi:hypothetical protein
LRTEYKALFYGLEPYLDHFLLQLGTHYPVAGDWNANDTACGSRLTAVKGRNLLQVIQQNNLNYLSTGEPTYWPTDANKIPDLLDLVITNGISDLHSTTESNLDLGSDHSAVTITISANAANHPTQKYSNGINQKLSG